MTDQKEQVVLTGTKEAVEEMIVVAVGEIEVAVVVEIVVAVEEMIVVVAAAEEGDN